MPSDIESYLADLRAQMADLDAALVQDALWDAEEHLRSEFDARRKADPGEEVGAALAAVIEGYGGVGEIAAAYREAESERVSIPASTAAARSDVPWATKLFGVLWDGRTWFTFAYLFLAFGTGIGYFTIVVTGLSLSVGFAVLIIGVPFMLGFLGLVRALSLLEGRIVEVLLGVRMPRRTPPGPGETGLVARVVFWLKDRRTWTTMLYMVLQLPLGVTYFALMVTGLSLGSGLVAAAVAQAITGRTYIQLGGNAEFLAEPWALPMLVLAGVVIFMGTVHLVRLIGRVHGAYAKALLVLWGLPAEAGASGGLVAGAGARR